MRGLSRLVLILLVLVLFCLGVCAQNEVTWGKVLLIGSQRTDLVGSWLEADPLTNPTYVPSSTHMTGLQGSDVQRFIRLYFPRSYEKLLEYEYIIISGVEISYFTQKQQWMLHDAVYEGGLGGMQTRSVQSMAEFVAHEWAESIVSDVFPNDADKVVSGQFSWQLLRMRFVINTNPNVPPIFKPYKHLEGVECTLTPCSTCIAIPKEGAVVTSYTIGGYPDGCPGIYPDPGFTSPGWMPHTMYWRYGNGTTWTHHDMFGGDNYWQPAINPYVPDMIVAEFIFSTGRKLPDDVVLVHRLRTKFANFISYKGFIYSLFDFIEKFGANLAPVISQMVKISSIADEGKQLYLHQEYEQSMSSMETAIAHMEVLRSEAMKLKDRALFWIYLIEWIAVTGASLLAGFAIWTFMVRRRLYREVTTTRLLANE